MPKYIVSGAISSSVVCEVEADSPEEAKEKALELDASPPLCHQCSGAGDGVTCWRLNGWDDNATVSDVEEVTTNGD